MMNDKPGTGIPLGTGTLHERGGQPELVFERQFTAPIHDVWASMTNPEQLGRWIGRWVGDPASGRVTFLMTAEDDPEPEEIIIRECAPPHRFSADTSVGEGSWHVFFELNEDAGVTTLVFGQRLSPGDDPRSVGPGWDYYLDRLVASREGRNPEDVDWNNYYPELKAYYAALVPMD
ncbi:hypothetical protein GCM10027416_29860 [Okibacterium endophyticum]